MKLFSPICRLRREHFAGSRHKLEHAVKVHDIGENPIDKTASRAANPDERRTFSGVP